MMKTHRMATTHFDDKCSGCGLNYHEIRTLLLQEGKVKTGIFDFIFIFDDCDLRARQAKLKLFW